MNLVTIRWHYFEQLAERLAMVTASETHPVQLGKPPIYATEDSPKENDASALEELKVRLRDPVNWTLNASMLGSLFIIIAMMIFQPQ